MNDNQAEFTYPPGHNWEGLTPSQVNSAYENQNTDIQEIGEPESGKEVRIEILSTEESNDNSES